MRVRPSGSTTQWGAGESGPTHGRNTAWPLRSLASNWARASSSDRVSARLLLLSVCRTFILFFTSLRIGMLRLRPVHRHENGPTWTFPGRPTVSVHQALAGSCVVPAGPSQAAPGAGHCHRVVASSCCHLLGTGWDFNNPSWGRWRLRQFAPFGRTAVPQPPFRKRPGRERRPAPQGGRPVRPRYGPAGSGAAWAAVRTGQRRIGAAPASDVHVQAPEAADHPP